MCQLNNTSSETLCCLLKLASSTSALLAKPCQMDGSMWFQLCHNLSRSICGNMSWYSSFFFLVWILATSLGCFKKWKIHESFVIIDLLPGKEANDLTYANKLISYLIQHFFNISKVNMDLKHNILLGCKWEKLCTANIFLSKWVCQ